jgi:hypothetical protein
MIERVQPAEFGHQKQSVGRDSIGYVKLTALAIKHVRKLFVVSSGRARVYNLTRSSILFLVGSANLFAAVVFRILAQDSGRILSVKLLATPQQMHGATSVEPMQQPR